VTGVPGVAAPGTRRRRNFKELAARVPLFSLRANHFAWRAKFFLFPRLPLSFPLFPGTSRTFPHPRSYNVFVCAIHFVRMACQP
jgi:hypothetical protein